MIEITQQQRLEEIAKCRVDPIYFIRNYGLIKHPDRGIIKFDLYPFQENVIKKMLENRFVIIVKGRQMGLSTLMAAYCVWFACFFNAKHILILANKGSVASNIIRKCKLFLENIERTAPWLIPKQVNDNMQSCIFENASVIAASTTTVDAARSEALSLLIFDEAAMIRDKLVYEVWTSARPTLATGGSAVILSTPKGVGNWFHEMWTKAEAGENDGSISMYPVKLHWSVHPERDEVWEQEERRTMSIQQFAQEYECSFEKSGNTVIDPETIEWIEKNTIREPIAREMFDRNFWIWERVQFGKNYIVGADVARGDGSDYSTVQVFCAETLEQVAEYRGKLPPANFGDLLLEVGKLYNNPMIVCENNAIGFGAIQRLLDSYYPKLYWSKKAEGQLFFDPMSWNMPGPDKIPGFQMGPKNRPLVINNWEELIRTRQFTIRSSRLLNEIKAFIWVNTGMNIRAQAADRSHDDLVIASAIGLFARSTTLRMSSQDVSQVDAMLSSISVDKGRHSIEELSIHQEVNRKKNPYKIGDQDFSWLVG